MSTRGDFQQALLRILDQLEPKRVILTGLMGARVNDDEVIHVESRPGYVYVRLHGNESSIIQAFNEATATGYNMPVRVVRDELEPRSFRLIGRHYGLYPRWPGQASSWLPEHASQHQFGGGDQYGRDIVWVQKRQFTPLMTHPVSGTMQLYVEPDWYEWDGETQYYEGAYTGDLTSYRPTGAYDYRYATIYMTPEQSLQIMPGASFSSIPLALEETYDHIPLVPAIDGINLCSVLLHTGTSSIWWDNTVDVRPVVHSHPATEDALIHHNLHLLNAHAATILKGSVVQIATGTFALPQVTQGESLYGITAEDIEPSTSGDVILGGYAQQVNVADDTDLGDWLYAVSGSLSVVSDPNPSGRVIGQAMQGAAASGAIDAFLYYDRFEPIIEENGAEVPQRKRLDFVGTGFEVYDDPTNDRTIVSGTAAGGPGAAAFTDLTDTPASYTDQARKVVRVNDDEDALEFAPIAAGSKLIQTHTVLHSETLAASGRFDVSSISQDYDHLLIRLFARSDVAAAVDTVALLFNGDSTAANYFRGALYQVNAVAGAVESDNPYIGACPAASSTSDDYGFLEIKILNYAGSKRKTASCLYTFRRNATESQMAVQMVNWESTAAINQITLQPDGYATDEFVTGSYVEVIGVKEEYLPGDIGGVEDAAVWVEIDSQEPSGTATVTFDSIPQIYDELRLVVRGRSTTASTIVGFNLYFNNDTTAANYRRIVHRAYDASSHSVYSADDAAAGILTGASAPSDYFGEAVVHIDRYAKAEYHAAMFLTGARYGASLMEGRQTTLHWETAAAITRVDVVAASGNFVAGSEAKLYGLLKTNLGSPVYARCQIHRSTNQSIPDDTTTAITFDVEDYDDGDMVDLGTYPTRITIPSDGEYVIGGNVRFAANSTNTRLLSVRLNGSTHIGLLKIQAAATGMSVLITNRKREFSAGDYLELAVNQNSGGALNAEAADEYSMYMWAHKVGPAVS